MHGTNCAGELIYKNGRCQQFSDKTECLNLTVTQPISFIEPAELWIPEVVDGAAIGIASDFEGWSFYAMERDRSANAVQDTTNAQKTTSLGDIMEYPKGTLNMTFLGLFSSHVVTFTIIGIVIMYLLKGTVKPKPNNQTINIQNPPITTPINKTVNTVITMPEENTERPASEKHTTQTQIEIQEIIHVENQFKHKTKQHDTERRPTKILGLNIY